MLFPKKQGQCRKSTILSFKYFYNPILINDIPSLRLKILSRLSICALYPSPKTPKALLCCSVNTTTMTTLKSWFSPIPLFGRVEFVQAWFSPAMPNCSLCQSTHGILEIWRFREQNPHTCICRLLAHPPLSFIKDKTGLFSKQGWQKHTWKG